MYIFSLPIANKVCLFAVRLMQTELTSGAGQLTYGTVGIMVKQRLCVFRCFVVLVFVVDIFAKKHENVLLGWSLRSVYVHVNYRLSLAQTQAPSRRHFIKPTLWTHSNLQPVYTTPSVLQSQD